MIILLSEAWEWYESAWLLLRTMQRLADKHWNQLPWEGELGRDEHLKELHQAGLIARPITLTNSEPQPSVVVVRGPIRSYQDHHPGPTEIAWVVEVADSSLAEDRTTKSGIYAGSLLPIYWIVNLIDGQVEVYSQPKAGKSPAYRQRQDYPRDAKLPLIIAGKEIATLTVRDLLPDAGS